MLAKRGSGQEWREPKVSEAWAHWWRVWPLLLFITTAAEPQFLSLFQTTIPLPPSSLPPPNPACHGSGIYFDQWNVSRGGDVCHFQVEVFRTQSPISHPSPSPASGQSVLQPESLRGCEEQSFLTTQVSCEWEISLCCVDPLKSGGWKLAYLHWSRRV